MAIIQSGLEAIEMRNKMESMALDKKMALFMMSMTKIKKTIMVMIICIIVRIIPKVYYGIPI